MDRAVLLFLQSLRTPAVLTAAALVSALAEVSALAVLPFFWLDARGGRALSSLLVTLPLCAALKCAVARPRPYTVGVTARPAFPALLPLGDDRSFPSGHAQLAGALSHALVSRRKVWTWFAAWAWCLAVAASRLILGVHYPSDVLAGVLLGALSALLASALSSFAFPLFAAVPLLFPLFPDAEFLRAAFLLAGGAVGVALSEAFPLSPVPFPRRLWRLPAGLCAALPALLLPAPVCFAALALFCTLGARALFFLLRI